MNTKPDIYVATTGGTIDSFYNPHEAAPHYVPQDSTSFVPHALEHLGFAQKCQTHYYGTYDSKELPLELVDTIIQDAIDKGFRKVILTMGTDTMPVIARHIQEKLEEHGERGKHMTVIVTGAMKPLRDENKQFFAESDGVSNLKFAVNTLSADRHKGAFVAMHVNRDPEIRLLHPQFLRKHVETDGDSHSAEDGARVKDSAFLYDNEKAAAHDAQAASRHP